ncbi:MAG: TolC family protein, partial [Spirochaetes bacterium]|nr:TolC family protein [Spirochaetota bacterium]
MKQRLLLPIFLLAMIVWLPAETLDYISLLEAALVHDAESVSLDLTVKQAEHRLQTQLFQTKQGVPQWRLGSSQLVLDEPYSWTFNPGYSYTKPDSWSVDISGMLGGTLLAAEETNQPLPDQSSTRFQATPAIQFGMPLWQRNYQSADSIRELRQQVHNSRLQAAQRALSLERDFIGKLSRLTAAESSLQNSLSEEAKARQQIDKARRLDGAQEGGTILLSLQRSLASSQSKRRQAEINRNRASQELSAFCGMEVTIDITSLAIP